MIKSFRGILTDGGQQRLNLHTNDGKTGYRIVKFQVQSETPGTVGYESFMKIWKVEQTSVPISSVTIDFSDNTLLAVALTFGSEDHGNGPFEPPSIFENEIFNQDIYVTHSNNQGAAGCNYYIELEQISLDLNESTVATLQNLRSE